MRRRRSGGFARAVFADAAGQALAVPETAVRYDADGASVMTVGANNRVKRALVQTGARGGGWVQLVKGPPAGTRVVQNAAAFLLDNDLIKPVEGAAQAAAGDAPARTAGIGHRAMAARSLWPLRPTHPEAARA